MSDLAFEQALAMFNEEFQAAEEFGNDWMPPDTGKEPYFVIVTSLKKGVKPVPDQDKPMVWWRLKGRIDDVANEAVHGKEFLIGFYKSTVWGIVKSQARALNKGIAVNTQEEADTVFEAAVGKALRVAVVTKESKKDGKDYTNCYIKEVIDLSDATPADEQAVAAEAVEQPA